MQVRPLNIPVKLAEPTVFLLARRGSRWPVDFERQMSDGSTIWDGDQPMTAVQQLRWEALWLDCASEMLLHASDLETASMEIGVRLGRHKAVCVFGTDSGDSIVSALLTLASELASTTYIYRTLEDAVVGISMRYRK